MSTVWFIKTLFGKKIIIEKPNNSLDSAENFFNLKAKKLKGEEFDFSKLKGKKTIIINTASECGFTNQYYELENFYRNFKEKINILAFPCNDFGKQEPGSSEEISNFCIEKFDITFQLMEKIKIKGAGRSPVYDWLCDPNKNGWNTNPPHWNFCKYLINENGELIMITNPVAKPSDEIFLNAIINK